MNKNNLILQHWEGPFYPGLKECQQSVIDYAERIGAEYKHVSGFPFSDRLGLTIQKIHFLDEMYDEYDQGTDARHGCLDQARMHSIASITPAICAWDTGRPVKWWKWGSRIV